MKISIILSYLLMYFVLTFNYVYAQQENVEPIILPKAIERWINYEQKWIDRSVDTNLIVSPKESKQKVAYSPEAGQWFPLKSYWIESDKMDGIFFNPDNNLKNTFIKKQDGKTYYRLLVHPESEKFYEKLTRGIKPAETFFATSTASSRTVLTRTPTGQFFFAKLSLDVEIGGAVRTIPRGEIARSVGTTKFLKEAKPNKINFLNESMGFMPKGAERGGMIVREIPTSLPKGHTLMPLFSIYAKKSPSILESWLKSNKVKNNTQALEFIRNELLIPFAKKWVELTFDEGIAIEVHAQNVLIEVDKKGMPTKNFFFRDLGGFNININQIENIPWKDKLPVLTSFHKDYHQEFSEQAIAQSLGNYFEGGFLFNVQNEFKRIFPHSKNSLEKNFRTIVLKELKKRNFTFTPSTHNADYDTFHSELAHKIMQQKTLTKSTACSDVFN